LITPATFRRPVPHNRCLCRAISAPPPGFTQDWEHYGSKPFTKPVENSVARVNDEVAVGENLDFQRKWWRFENVAWAIFTLIVFLDLSGLFGRGPLAKAERRTTDGTIEMKYERIERTGSPSIMTIQFGQSAIHNVRQQ
jgi:hypothetical protein